MPMGSNGMGRGAAYVFGESGDETSHGQCLQMGLVIQTMNQFKWIGMRANPYQRFRVRCKTRAINGLGSHRLWVQILQVQTHAHATIQTKCDDQIHARADMGRGERT